jgi:hypothetical protein
MALHRHSGRRNDVDPASLTPPDSALARDAEEAAQDLLSPTLLNHITFDRELLYMAAMFHDTSCPRAPGSTSSGCAATRYPTEYVRASSKSSRAMSDVSIRLAPFRG